MSLAVLWSLPVAPPCGARFSFQDPLLYDGRKCHIKFYVLLMSYPDGIKWHLYTFKEGYLSISPTKWSADDISKETQVAQLPIVCPQTHTSVNRGCQKGTARDRPNQQVCFSM